MKKITVNGKEYNAVDFDLNTMCDFDDLGISIEDFGTKQMSMIRAYVALCMKTDVKSAGNEIQAHIVNGGTLDDIADTLMTKVDESDFFRALGKTTEAQNPESTAKKK